MEIFDFPELLEKDEQLLPLNQACEKFNPPISRPTCERFARGSCRGEILRTVRIGNRRFTTLSEIKRFSLAQLPNPAPNVVISDKPTSDTRKRPVRKGGGMTSAEIAAGRARHKLD